MSDIVLSAGVRQNLLALQTTAKLVTITQNRLATGKKVNTALDNPVNFFTASGLQSRASDLSALLDAMGNGVKTLQAADNGLTAITHTIESMQSTLLQARQDRSFKTATYALDAAAIGTTVTKSLSFSGGSVGTTAVAIGLNTVGTGGTAATLSTSANYAPPTGAQQATLTSQSNYAAPGADTAITITFGSASVDATIATTNTTVAEAVDAINGAILGDPDANGVFEAYDNGGKLAVRTIGNVDGNFNITGGTATLLGGTPTIQTGSDGQIAFTVNGDAVTLTAAEANVTAAVNAANLQLQAANSAFEAYDNGGKLGIREKVAQGATLNIAGADAGLFTAAGDTGIAGTGGSVKTIDQLVSAINAALAGKVKAANDNGKLQLESFSTGDLTIAGINSGGIIDGGAGTATVDGNNVRANLATQFNDLRDQLNKLAQDASFNGINLLSGDVLKVIFNETATSTIDVQAKDLAGNPFSISAANLNIALLVPANLDLDSAIDGFLDTLKQALNVVRSQASNFGSYLSIVQNRQDFTKAMINTLQTGADGLVLADTNEEGANMLALQTRQQLSTTALSLAAQADQGVLRLFG
jgi:flagellin-like hook-associated protein FlgL